MDSHGIPDNKKQPREFTRRAEATPADKSPVSTKDDEDFAEEGDGNIGAGVSGIDLPPGGGGSLGDSTIQVISTGNNSGLHATVQPGTSGFDMGARFDGRSECSVCLKG